MAGTRKAFSTYNLLKEPDPGDVKAEFGRRIQARMIKLKIDNQSELARRAQTFLPKGKTFGRDLISGYVRGLHIPDQTSLYLHALAKALECEPADLVPPAAAEAKKPAYVIKAAGGDRVHMQINRSLSEKAAAAIQAILKKEDKL